jgi:cytochrome b pre-mRNA-processing protein 3
MAVGLAAVYGRREAKGKMILFKSTRGRERAVAEEVYAACVMASRRPALFLTFGVPDTLQGRFEMLALHLFPLLHRLMHDPGDDPELARLISESFVNDMDAAMREMGVGDVTVPKRMKKLYASFAGRVSAYKTALQGGPEEMAGGRGAQCVS